jgi:uncharacterized protein
MTQRTMIAPPFTAETAARKVRMAEDVWNTRDPDRVCLSYKEDICLRNRSEFFQVIYAIRLFLRRKWDMELEYRLIKALWAFTDARIAVRFQYEWCDGQGLWYRAYGNELWEFASDGLMCRREASINDVSIAASARRFHWDAPGPRPADHPDLEGVGG